MGYPNTTPFEIMAAPFEVYLAPVGTAFPAVTDSAPVSPWVKVGTSGNLNYKEDGVSVSHPQSVEPWRALGDIAPRKYFRTEEQLMIRLTLADVSLEQYKHALNDNTVTDSGTSKKVGLSRGTSVAQKALLVRGPSPYGDNKIMQYEVPIVFASGSPEVVYANSGEPAGLELEFSAVVDSSAVTTAERFGRLVAEK
jgi:hypothetical protein